MTNTVGRLSGSRMLRTVGRRKSRAVGEARNKAGYPVAVESTGGSLRSGAERTPVLTLRADGSELDPDCRTSLRVTHPSR